MPWCGASKPNHLWQSTVNCGGVFARTTARVADYGPASLPRVAGVFPLHNMDHVLANVFGVISDALYGFR